MSKVLQLKLEGCDNHYSAEELYENFGMSEKELQICMNCSNRRMECGTITCKYILEGLDGGDT